MNACAAARAGLARPGPIEVSTEDPDTGLPDAAIGHPMAGVTDGFAGVGRLWRLCDVACADLIESMSDPGRGPDDAFLWLHVGGSYYEAACHAAERAAPRSSLLGQLPEPLAAERNEHERRVETLLLPRVGARLGIAPARQSISFGSAADFFRLLAQAPDVARRVGARRWIVGAVDSLVDPMALSVLAELQLLKAGENPVGLAPGECAAFLAFESSPAPARPDAPSLLLEAPMYAAEEAHRFSHEPPQGERLAAAMASTVGYAASGARPTVAVGDLNGDLYRSAKLGDALPRLRGVGLADIEHWLPATSFGDTGAAAAALGLCVAVRAFARGYARGPSILVWAGSDDGAVGSCLVSASSN